MVSSWSPQYGEIIKIDFDPQAGHEQAGWRPALVLSRSDYNRKTRMAVVVPITNQRKGYPFEVPLAEFKSVKTTGVVLMDGIRQVDWLARRARPVEMAPPELLAKLRAFLAYLLSQK